MNDREKSRNGDGAVSPVDAFSEVVLSSQDVVLRRLDVLKIEAERRIASLRAETIALALAGLLAVSAWALLLGAAVVYLSREVGVGAALALLGVANLVLAFAVQIGARQAVKRRESRGEIGGEE